MAFDGNGNWIPEFSAKEDRDAGVKILASRFDDVFQQDLKESFERCLTNDGQSRPLQDFNFNNHKGINVADPETDSDVVNVRSMTKAVKELEDMLEEKKANVDGSNFTEETSKAVLESLSDETKGGFVALGMPDYDSVISVGHTYTATSNGYIVIRTQGNHNYYNGSIGGLGISTGGNFANYHEADTALFPIKKGATLSGSGSANVYFIPAIGG